MLQSHTNYVCKHIHAHFLGTQVKRHTSISPLVGVCVYVLLCEMCDCLLWDVYGDARVGLRVEGRFVCKV